MRTQVSKKDCLACESKIKNIQTQVQAYGKKWNQEGWRKFFQRNYKDILFLIPGNNSYNDRVETLNALL